MASAGCVLAAGHPAMRTIPPLTTAAARNGTALDRSGSITQCRAAIGPGETRQRLAWVSSTSTPASRSIATVIATCGADGTDSPVCTIVSPSAKAAPDSSSPETNCDDADASISTVPPATAPAAAHRERQAVAVDVHTEPAQRVQQRRDRAGAGLLVAVEHHRLGGQRRDGRNESQHGARQPAVDAGAAAGRSRR